MKLIKIAILMNFALIANTGHALEIPDIETRIESSGLGLIFPIKSLVPNTGFLQLNVDGGANLSISVSSPIWSVSNRVQGTNVSLINGINNGGSIQLTSPGGLVITGSTMPDARFSLSASAVPEADTYAMLLTGLGLIGAIVARRKA